MASSMSDSMKMMEKGQREYVFNIMLLAFGAALGAATSAIPELKTNLGTDKFTAWSLVECSIFLGGILVTAVTGAIMELTK